MLHRGFWSLLCLVAVGVWTYSIQHFVVEDAKYTFEHVQGIVKVSHCFHTYTTWEVHNADYLEVQVEVAGHNRTVDRLVTGFSKKRCPYHVGDSIDVCVLYYQTEYVISGLNCRFETYMGHIFGFILWLLLGSVMMGTGLYFSLGLRKYCDKH
jgi:hypothetical protein